MDLSPEKFLQMHFRQRWQMPFCKFPELCIGELEEPYGRGVAVVWSGGGI